KKNDEVIVLTGKDKGKTGKVITAMPKERKVVVAGINQVQRHRKADAMGNKAGVVTKNLPIDVSNVAIVDPKTGKATKVGVKLTSDGKKVRFAKKSGETL
ncbi:MAG: 50S ribosomal protein L24, partial [Alphaproteobacteria bacterium]|nr:50S ribosomal protein L24 [Alphaproteobacteria bacterium]